MSDITIYVDLDATLVQNTGNSSIPQEWRKPLTGNIFKVEDTYIIRRPYCLEFLDKINQMVNGNVYILTAGERNYQTAVCNACGITPLVNGIYGAQDTFTNEPSKYKVLIDNDATMSLNTVQKIMKMGYYPFGDSLPNKDFYKVNTLLKKMVIPIQDYDPNKVDTCLLKTIAQVKAWIDQIGTKPSYSTRIKNLLHK